MAKVGRVPWWQWLPWLSWRIVACVEAADEIMERIPRNGIVLVGSLDRPKWAVFDCPCGTGHRIMVTLDIRHRPHWAIIAVNPLTLAPSIDFHSPERRCHYFIRRGRTIWVREYEGGSYGYNS